MPPDSRKVLIVEDAEVDRTLVRALLRDHDDLEAKCVGNGQEALLAIARDRPEVVVTDMVMPEMGGLELVEKVKEGYPDLPVIIMTSRGSEEVAVRALQHGAASYVPKHSLATKLLDTIETVLAATVSRRQRVNLMNGMLESQSSFVLENDRALFPPLIRFLQDTMSELGLFRGMDTTRAGLAIEEALNNAAEHGNLELSSDLCGGDARKYVQLMQERATDEKYCNRHIYVDARFTADEAVFEIRDEGKGFDPSKLPDSKAPENLVFPGGRGLTLMRMFMDDVEFNDTGNVVRMTKRRAAATG